MKSPVPLLLVFLGVCRLSFAAAAGRRAQAPRRRTRGIQQSTTTTERQLAANFRMRGTQYLRKTCHSMGVMRRRDRQLGMMMSSAKRIFCEYANIECINFDSLIQLEDNFNVCLDTELSAKNAVACDSCLDVSFASDKPCRPQVFTMCQTVNACADLCGDCLAVATAYFSCIVGEEFDCFEFVCSAAEL